MNKLLKYQSLEATNGWYNFKNMKYKSLCVEYWRSYLSVIGKLRGGKTKLLLTSVKPHKHARIDRQDGQGVCYSVVALTLQHSNPQHKVSSASTIFAPVYHYRTFYLLTSAQFYKKPNINNPEFSIYIWVLM